MAKSALIDRYTEYDNYNNYDIHYLVFNKNSKESTVYKYVYKYALSNNLKVSNESIRDAVIITLRPFYS
jgi:predicted RNA-binding protein with PIN domain